MTATIQAIAASRPLLTQPVAIFLAVLIIILVAPIVLNKLKIPHVIGLIVAGVIVGPYGVNLLARDMSFEIFGQVGLLYLMFLAGVEIDMFHLRRNLRRGAVFGVYTFAIPLVVGAVGAGLLLRLPPLTAVLMASMFAAHTLIAYPIVSRFGLTRQPAVVIAIAGTIFTVLGSLIVLAAVSGVCSTGSFSVVEILKLLGSLALYCVVITYAYPRITRWFFKRWRDSILQFIYVLAAVILAAQLAVWAGIEGVFGAFFAGLVLNRYIPARSPLMSRIEFVGNSLFIPYFLIGVGMLINVRVVAAGWSTIYAAAVMSAIAMFTKWLAALAAQRTFGLRGVDRSVMYQLTNAHTAVALAVVTIGYGMGLFDEVILNATVIMILVTCSVSSIGTAQAASRMKILALEADAPADDTRHNRRRNTLVAVASQSTATELVDLALLMRAPFGGSQVYALHVRNDNTPAQRAAARASLEAAERAAASVDVPLTPLDRFDLNFVTGMLNTVEERDIDRIVIGLHRRANVIDSFYGDKLTNLLRATNRMVIITRCFIPVNTVTRILVAVPEKAEFETGFAEWVSALATLAQQLGCRLIFCSFAATQPHIAATLRARRHELRSEFMTLEGEDDIVLLANKVLDDDLFVVVNARRASLSHSAWLDTLPEFLRRNFAGSNLLMIFPEQFGEHPDEMAITDTMTADIVTPPSPLWLKLRGWWRAALARMRRVLTERLPNDR